MKVAVTILFLLYYLFGSIVLPLGDFSTVADLPDMYHHCKATEDIDLTAMDFVTDHLLNIDGLFDQHDHHDRQKPHKPFHSQFQHHSFQIVHKNKIEEYKLMREFDEHIKHQSMYSSNYSYLTISSIFHPPTTV